MTGKDGTTTQQFRFIPKNGENSQIPPRELVVYVFAVPWLIFRFVAKLWRFAFAWDLCSDPDSDSDCFGVLVALSAGVFGQGLTAAFATQPSSVKWHALIVYMVFAVMTVGAVIGILRARDSKMECKHLFNYGSIRFGRWVLLWSLVIPGLLISLGAQNMLPGQSRDFVRGSYYRFKSSDSKGCELVFRATIIAIPTKSPTTLIPRVIEVQLDEDLDSVWATADSIEVFADASLKNKIANKPVLQKDSPDSERLWKCDFVNKSDEFWIVVRMKYLQGGDEKEIRAAADALMRSIREKNVIQVQVVTIPAAI